MIKRAADAGWPNLRRAVFSSPARLSVAGFLLIIFLGTILLMLPAAAAGDRLGFVDALFTATSASCVTGLIVVDTGSAFTLFGQLVILALIQVGGLGIMTLSTLFVMMAGRRPSLTGRMAIQDAFTHSQDWTPGEILWDVLRFVMVAETIGVAILFLCFLPDYPPLQAFYTALFHSVSAFCNAGFSLFSDSLAGYRENWVVNLTLCGLIITGGLGFLALSELNRRPLLKRRVWSRLSLHSKLVLFTTALLLGLGTLLVLFLEWHNTLAPLSLPGRFLAAFFQSTTLRTAGFNTLPTGEMANVTLFLFIVFMFIGGGPGSCAGGVKVTTIACLFLVGLSRLRHQYRPQVFSRTIAESSITKAMSVVLAGMFLIAVGCGCLLITELGEVPHPESRGKFLELLFEMVSAFGTVGLSTGVTEGLTVLGRLIITVAMFMGRLGPLVVALAVTRLDTPPRYRFAWERIMIG